MHTSQCNPFSFEEIGIWKLPNLLSDDFDESLIHSNEEVRCPTLEDPATSFGELYTQEKVRFLTSTCTNFTAGQSKHKQTSGASSFASFLMVEFREEDAIAAAAAASTAWASLCLFSFLPRFLASLTSRRNWFTKIRSHFLLLKASSSRERFWTTFAINFSARKKKRFQEINETTAALMGKFHALC